MLRSYHFFGEAPIEFDDAKTVRELIAYAFQVFDYYEPLGMDTVTVFQCHHSDGNYGRMTSDTSRLCSEEIQNRDELCFAYHIPGFMYYVEGGWGHHMQMLGNHPAFQRPVSLKLRCGDFNHTVVFEGMHPFRSVLAFLQKAEDADTAVSRVTVHVMAYPRENYEKQLDLSDPILNASIAELERSLPDDGVVTLIVR